MIALKSRFDIAMPFDHHFFSSILCPCKQQKRAALLVRKKHWRVIPLTIIPLASPPLSAHSLDPARFMSLLRLLAAIPFPAL
jgi:hypothetical protein